MAFTVSASFNHFAGSINIPSAVSDDARSSRDWLRGQIARIAEKDPNFPVLASGFDIDFGSFSRKTKIDPLDDIDIMVALSAENSVVYSSTGLANQYDLKISEGSPLRRFCNASSLLIGDSTLNSIKILNCFKGALSGVAQYRLAELKRNQAAVCLDLTSKPWTFDVVPCFQTTNELSGSNYYLIPDGQGKWMKTAPRIDKQRCSDINQKHGGKVLQIIRFVKYWNSFAHMKKIPSYFLECIVLDIFDATPAITGLTASNSLGPVFRYVANTVLGSFRDPKGILISINDLSFDDRQKVSNVALRAAEKAEKAFEYEQKGDHRSAIKVWREVFGATHFPSVG